MIVWHVTTLKKLKRYQQNGLILPPVRAWESAEKAEEFSKQTGRRIIIKLNFPTDAERLPGHQGKAYWLPDKPYFLENM